MSYEFSGYKNRLLQKTDVEIVMDFIEKIDFDSLLNKELLDRMSLLEKKYCLLDEIDERASDFIKNNNLKIEPENRVILFHKMNELIGVYIDQIKSLNIVEYNRETLIDIIRKS